MENHKSPSIRHLTSDTFGRPPEKENPVLESLGTPHIESFNHMLKDGLCLVLENMDLEELELSNNTRIGLKLQSFVLFPPQVHNSMMNIKATTIYPSECRQRAETYKGLLTAKLAWWVDGQPKVPLTVNLGEIPVMVKSKACHLNGLTPAQLVARGEDEDMWGGVFIIKGHERIIRMLVQVRSNYPMILYRSSWKNRGAQFTDLGVYIRCVAFDQSVTNNVLHFIGDGTAKVMFSYEKNLYFAPLVLVLKALIDVTDEFIFQQLLLGAEDDLYYRGCVTNMLRQLHEEMIHSHNEAKQTLGKAFRFKFKSVPSWKTDEEVCDSLIKKCIAINVSSPLDKFQLLCLMSRKLFSAAQGRSKPESMDTTMMHEALLGGQLYQQYLAERLTRWVQTLKAVILKKASGVDSRYMFTETELQAALKRCPTLEGIMANFLATGNITSTSGLGLMQDKGLTIVAENINRMRYMSHFRSIHRGSYFQEMRTTDARKLLPDAWGFICPVHTPDGMPCGLLNHLSRHCKVVTTPVDTSKVPEVLGNLGMEPLGVKSLGGISKYWVSLDGRVLGVVSQEKAQRLVDQLRYLKTQGDRVPETLEIVLIPQEGSLKGQYPGLFLFSGTSRLIRPVFNLASKSIEMVGTFEQVYLNIAVVPSEIIAGVTTHLEISETTFLSNLASLIPMPDCNQSPRNMYQCQMGKQSMGTPVHTWHLQSETKLYRLQTPSAPLFRPAQYDAVELDNHAMGVNAIVAVISYTGYDMEDAMIINKSAYERGLAHGSIYKSEFLDLQNTNYFARDPEKPDLAKTLDKDGLPFIGSRLEEGDPMYCLYDTELSRYQVKKYRGKETVYVESVKMCGEPILSTRTKPLKACVTMRVPRNPTVGDKFASRAGQKGICSQKWPAEDLPFTESGLVPDIVFNPHGFPSRMTIAMMVELMAGKAAALNGMVHDATPFRFTESDTAIEYFSKLLQEGGYNYLGTERMYSGVDGREMKADIFFGVVYYQRLRHMVSDKWQVRSTGVVDTVTRQPVKGRRRGGGVRFGEMERDSLISHGASFLLQDRLLHCSDKSSALVCRECGSLLSTYSTAYSNDHVPVKQLCRVCGDKAQVELVELPHILRFLVAQLAAVNISIKIDLTKEQQVTI